MISLARFSIRRPKLALASWLVAAVVLTLIGLGVSSALVRLHVPHGLRRPVHH